MRKKMVVLGAGSWGTSLANVLAENGHDVLLWARREELVQEINLHHRNDQYLPGVDLHEKIVAVSNLQQAVQHGEVVIVVLPSQSIRSVAKQISSHLSQQAFIVHATKGFEQHSLKRMSEVLQEELPNHFHSRIAVLSGPSHAEEVVQKSPTTVVVASNNQHVAESIQSLFINDYFRVYTNPDLIGIEVGGALKNIIALATGLASGLGLGDNAKAALITRGLAEIARLGQAMGAKPITFVGLAGVGDLIATCTSEHSRNWRAGYMLSKGSPLEKVLKEMGMVVEGVITTQTGYDLAKQYQVEMPITEQLYQVLFHGKNPEQAVRELMTRGKTQELESVLSGWDHPM